MRPAGLLALLVFVFSSSALAQTVEDDDELGVSTADDDDELGVSTADDDELGVSTADDDELGVSTEEEEDVSTERTASDSDDEDTSEDSEPEDAADPGSDESGDLDAGDLDADDLDADDLDLDPEDDEASAGLGWNDGRVAGWATFGVSTGIGILGAILLAIGVDDVNAIENAADGTMWSAVEEAHARAPLLTASGATLLVAGALGMVTGAVLLSIHGESGTWIRASLTPSGMRLSGRF